LQIFLLIQFCRYIDKKANVHEIAPYKQNCNDLEWRLSLKEGDQIDACDTSHVWYNATVLGVRQTPIEDGSNVNELFIGTLFCCSQN